MPLSRHSSPPAAAVPSQAESCRSFPGSIYPRCGKSGRHNTLLLEGFEEPFCGLQIGGVETLAEPGVDRLKARHCVGATVLVA